MVTHSQGHSWSLVCTFRHDNYTQILTKGESEKVRQKNRVGNVVGVGTHSRELPGKQTRKAIGHQRRIQKATQVRFTTER